MNTKDPAIAAPVDGIVLLPCPFCGSGDIDRTFWSDGNGKSGPGCMSCGGNAESVAAWNSRTDRTRDLMQLANAVSASEFSGIDCDDIDGVNWFDRRKQLTGVG